MLTIDRYLRPASLEEAYQAAQQKNSAVLGGMLWLRLGHRRITTAIDLSALGLDTVEETPEGYRIGAYVSLRTLETHEGLNAAFGGAFRSAFSPIVGVQFRNLATVGGSVFGRFGFSDVVTLLLALGASVELYRGGRVTLEEFCAMGRVRDILTHIILPRRDVQIAFLAHRNAATDFPALNVCAVREGDTLRVTVGARPLRACLYRYPLGDLTPEQIAEDIAAQAVLAANNRASEEYRRHLCRVLVRRAVRHTLCGKEEL